MGQRKSDAGPIQEEGSPKKRASQMNVRRVRTIGLQVGLFVLLCWVLSRGVYVSNDGGEATSHSWQDFRTSMGAAADAAAAQLPGPSVPTTGEMTFS